ncbi:hypothetical protein LPB140_00170 [Sphingorhabdus lutea]|uniref:Uncharacterized protein n=1 Tax=Sphingorhabdus lutea TaxID=1913578 RepID=A0A1L3J8Q5_9SPHN|nr:hypothetical protein [Sphingorhabdus lutea]APG61516.1 hypothetical protein LPB140_00170 [Sphingorhabdus lutea]
MKIFNIVALALLFTPYTSYFENEVPKTCSKIDHWVYDEIEFTEIAAFTEVTVHKDDITYWGYKFSSERKLVKFLKKDLNDTKASIPRHIFLRSDKNISCERFNHVATIIDAHYPCKDGKLCIWAHGLGAGAMPLGIGPPPQN